MDMSNRMKIKPSSPLKLFVRYRALASMAIFSAYTALVLSISTMVSILCLVILGGFLVFELLALPGTMAAGAALSTGLFFYGQIQQRKLARQFHDLTEGTIDR